MPFEDQVLQAIQVAMPAGANIRVVPSGESVSVRVSWKVNDDSLRPNKMSKTISICFPYEVAQDLASASATVQAGA